MKISKIVYLGENSREYFENLEYKCIQSIKCALSKITKEDLLIKISRERIRRGNILVDPKSLNRQLSTNLVELGWKTKYKMSRDTDCHLEIDFFNRGVGVEAQFGKYAFISHDILLKAPIFSRHADLMGLVELIPMQSLCDRMSSGIGNLENMKKHLDLLATTGWQPLLPIVLIGVDV